MAYRHFNAGRRGGDGDSDGDFVWPWRYPHTSKPARPHYPPDHASGRSQDRPPPTPPWPFPSPPSSAKSPTARRGTAARKRSEGAPPSGSDPPVDLALALALALNGLYEAVSAALSVLEGYEAAFEQHVREVATFAAPGTLDRLWRDMVTRRDEEARFRAVTERIGCRLSMLKTALRASRAGRYAPTAWGRRNPAVVERRLRAARKAETHCEEVLERALGARMERMACRLLVEEVGELMAMLDPKTHFNLYHDVEDEAMTQEKGKGQDMGSGKGKEKGKEKEAGVSVWGETVPEQGHSSGESLQRENRGMEDEGERSGWPSL